MLVDQWDGKFLPGAPTRGIRGVLLGPTLEQLKKVHSNGTLNELSRGGPWAFLGANVNRSEWKITYPGGSTLQWVTAERADNARGIRCDVVLIDEADDIDPEVIDSVVDPWFTEPWSMAMQMVAGTPRRGRQGLLYRQHMRGVEGKPGYYSFHATYRDAHNVNRAFVEKKRLETPPSYFAREYECDFDSAEGLVYPAFSEGLHVRKPHPSAVPTEVIVGCDWGFVDPTVFLAIGIYGSGADAVAWVLREYYESGKTIDDWAAVATEWKRLYPKAKWYADPSQPATIEAIRIKSGVNIIGADNDRDDGIFTVNHWLTPKVREVNGAKVQRTYLFVDPTCTNTIREFGLYRRKRDAKNKDRVLEKIEDKDDHTADSLRYALFTRFGLPPATRIESGQGR